MQRWSGSVLTSQLQRHGYYCSLCLQTFLKTERGKLWSAGAFNTGKALMGHVKYAIYCDIYRTQIPSK